MVAALHELRTGKARLVFTGIVYHTETLEEQNGGGRGIPSGQAGALRNRSVHTETRHLEEQNGGKRGSFREAGGDPFLVRRGEGGTECTFETILLQNSSPCPRSSYSRCACNYSRRACNYSRRTCNY